MGEPLSPTTSFQIFPLGDAALVIQFGETIDPALLCCVRDLTDLIADHPILGVIEAVPAYTTVTVYYDPLKIELQNLTADLQRLIATQSVTSQIVHRVIEIPVCYGGDFGPDLELVARHNSLTTDEVIAIHSSAEYLVYMIGFAPGFPYLGGMSARIATPRRESPRLKTPAGSVGIAGMQTGVYPLETPGGWQLIGRTPIDLFQPSAFPPTLLRAGDSVRFQPITEEQFDAMRSLLP